MSNHMRAAADRALAETLGPNWRQLAPEAPSLELVAHLHDVTDCLLMAEVYATVAARMEGASWSRIGAAKGISRQAASKRYGPIVALYTAEAQA